MEMRSAVLLHHPTKIEEAVTAAIIFENLRSNKPLNGKGKFKPFSGIAKATTPKELGKTKASWMSTITCYKCQAKGHKASDCPTKKRPEVSAVSSSTPRLYL